MANRDILCPRRQSDACRLKGCGQFSQIFAMTMSCLTQRYTLLGHVVFDPDTRVLIRRPPFSEVPSLHRPLSSCSSSCSCISQLSSRYPNIVSRSGSPQPNQQQTSSRAHATQSPTILPGPTHTAPKTQHGQTPPSRMQVSTGRAAKKQSSKQEACSSQAANSTTLTRHTTSASNPESQISRIHDIDLPTCFGFRTCIGIVRLIPRFPPTWREKKVP